MVEATAEDAGLDCIIEVEICSVIWITDVSTDADTADPELLLMHQRLEILVMHIQVVDFTVL